ncbi:OsmC family protein [Halocola ammonii]
MQVKYLGTLRCEATHCDSKNQIITDAPKDNHGKGEAFSPTDLMCTSLASCMITIMGITANKRNILIEAMEAKIEKAMLSNPRRIGEVKIELRVKGTFSETEKKALKKAAIDCPVALSIHPEVKQDVSIHFEE